MFDPFHDIVCISYLTRRNSLASPSHVCRVTVAKVRLFYRIWQHSVRSRASTRSNIDIDSLIYWSRFRRGRRVNTVACFVRTHMPWVFVMLQRATLESRSKLFTPALDHTLEVQATAASAGNFHVSQYLDWLNAWNILYPSNRILCIHVTLSGICIEITFIDLFVILRNHAQHHSVTCDRYTRTRTPPRSKRNTILRFSEKILLHKSTVELWQLTWC